MIVYENNKKFAETGQALGNGGASPLFPFMTNLALADMTLEMREKKPRERERERKRERERERDRAPRYNN